MKRLIPLLCILMAIMIVVIGMISVSFSWFEPDVKEGIGLEFKGTTQLRAQTCDFKTYAHINIGNKLVDYDVNPVIAGNTVEVTAVTSEEKTTPGFAYFKTVITNSSIDYDTVVSIYLASFNLATDSKASIGVIYPTNSYRTFTSNQSDIHIIRNANVPKYVKSDANPGQLIVEWFVKCDKGSVEFDPSSVYLMYN